MRFIIKFEFPVPSSTVIRWTLAHHAPLCMGFRGQEYQSGLPFPSRGNLPHPGIRARYPALAGGFCTAEPPEKPLQPLRGNHFLFISLFISSFNSMKSECESEFQSMEFLFLDKHIIIFYLNIKLTLIGINNNVCPELEVKHTNHS